MADTLIFDSALRLLGDHADAATFAAVERGEWPATLWKALVGAGFIDMLPDRLQPDEVPNAMALYRAQGRTAAPVPLLEAQVAAWLGFQSSQEKVMLAALPRSPQQTQKTPQLTAAWPAHSATVACTAEGFALQGATVRGEATRSYCGEPQRIVQTGQAQWRPFAPTLDFDLIWQFCALARAAMMRGALEHMLTLTVDYANTRVQFGKPLAKQQVIQHQLALMAEEVAAAGVAVDYATRSFSLSDAEARWQAVAAAKIRAGEAAGIAAAIAHQVHGAIGFTQEYQLQRYSRRVWTWRNEFGTEAEWSLLLGQRLSAAHAPPLWHTLTREPLIR